ncbi:AraC family transcriptional regulator [Herbaspirillum rhizosphaerae]|uniref:AraC family transcriptional regulator n=1 Tax=Herbaspirillum rhizosphaerae TaxID=346179 RepID=UPI00067B7E3E|nr:AraC family transcriptional regulator [Herbaspirillum rhizosphaerae]
MDPLDEALAAMRVERALYARLEASAPWGLNTRRIDGTTRFGLMVRGRALLTMADNHEVPPVELVAGDCFFIPHGAAYQLQDAPGSPLENCVDAVRNSIDGLVTLGAGNGAAAATIVSGWFHYDERGARPLLDALPPLLHIRMDDARTQVLQASLQLLAMETAQRDLGSGLIISRLADIIFAQAVRAYMHALDPETEAGWLAALSDRRIGLALRALHRDVAAGWTVDTLAAAAGMSRSAFAQRFKEKVGRPPLDYLAHWRMFRAGDMLLHSDRALAAIAENVGYESEAAFNKAFKRWSGIAPGAYRRQAKAIAGAQAA